MKTSNNLHHRKGHYLGTVIDDKWWKRYKKDKLFARGNGNYWYPAPKKSALKGYRIGVWIEDPEYSPDIKIGDCLEELASRLSKNGLTFSKNMMCYYVLLLESRRFITSHNDTGDAPENHDQTQ